jgi:hypothetical protein
MVRLMAATALLSRRWGELLKYDDASWHYGGDFPAGLPDSAGGIHIGIFLSWMFVNGYAADEDEFDDLLQIIKDRSMPPGKFMCDRCGEKLVDAWFNEKGNEFAGHYYANEEEQGNYFYDLTDQLGAEKSVYEADDSWDTYDILAPHITKAHQEWLASLDAAISDNDVAKEEFENEDEESSALSKPSFWRRLFRR